MKYLQIILICLVTWCARASEVIPPTPEHYFNDYASVISSTTASQLNQSLEDFERQTSDQVVVAIYPKMQSDSSISDYAVRVFRAWKVGQKDKNNGVVLFIFVQDRKMFLATGYGLEGALPDALCKQIVSDDIAPHFKSGDYDGGVTLGVQAIMAAIKGEYKGNGQTVAGQHQTNVHNASSLIFIAFIIIVIVISIRSNAGRSRGIWYSGGGWSGGGGWGGGSSGGGWGGGGGGGFSGGGGSSGGGGAGGSW